MLEHIFGSETRTRILKFFCINAQEKFFVRELSRRLDLQLNSIRRELDNLEEFGFLQSTEENGKKFYAVNQEFPLFLEIKNLILKATTLDEMYLADKMSKISGLKLLVFTGLLTKAPTLTDVLIVGKVKRGEFDRHLKKIAQGLPHELRVTFLTPQDYIYRLSIVDKFIYDIFAHNRIVVVDKISKDLNRSFLDDFTFKHYKQIENPQPPVIQNVKKK